MYFTDSCLALVFKILLFYLLSDRYDKNDLAQVIIFRATTKMMTAATVALCEPP